MQAEPDVERPPYAMLLRRLAALAYDALILAGIVFGLTFFFVLIRGGEAIPPGSWWFGSSLLGANFLYFGWSWTRGGKTLGARAWRFRVETRDGAHLGWRRSAYRYLAAWVLLLPPGLGLLWSLWDREGLCWHDRLSGTRVVLEPG